jgi:hypothetical protein
MGAILWFRLAVWENKVVVGGISELFGNMA